MTGTGGEQQQQASPYRNTVVVGAPPRNGLAVAGLLMAFGAVVMFLIDFVVAPGPVEFWRTLGLGLATIIGVGLSAVGLTLAYTGFKEIERSHGRYSGRGWAVIGMVINLPVLVLLVVGSVWWLLSHI